MQNNFTWINSLHQIVEEEWHHENVIRISDLENVNFYDKENEEETLNIVTKLIKGIC